MVKNSVSVLFILFVLLISCRNGEDNGQFIDQKIQLYIDSAGQDMLNAKIQGSYFSIALNDLYGDTDVAPVALSLKKTTDTVSYIEYIAGAKRIPIGTLDNETTIYQSKIALSLKKKKGSNTLTTQDTLVLNYNYSPTLFQIHSAEYNGVQVFVKNSDPENRIKIFK